MKPLAYMMIGVPGSGKSYYFEHVLNRENVRLISSDAYIEQMAEAAGKLYGEVFQDYIKEATKWMNDQLVAAMTTMMDIVWDQTNLTIKSRRPKIDRLRKAGYDVVAIAFEIPGEELARRRAERESNTGKAIPQSVLETMGKDYCRPTCVEGFNKVIVITPFEEYIYNE